MRARLYGRVLLVDVLEERVERLERGHQHGAVGHGQPVDRLQPVPGPGLHALGERVVHADGDVDFLGLVAGHVLLELFLACRRRWRSPWPGCRCAAGCRRSARRRCPSARPCGRRARCRARCGRPGSSGRCRGRRPRTISAPCLPPPMSRPGTPGRVVRPEDTPAGPGRLSSRSSLGRPTAGAGRGTSYPDDFGLRAGQRLRRRLSAPCRRSTGGRSRRPSAPGWKRGDQHRALPGHARIRPVVGQRRRPPAPTRRMRGAPG